MSTEGSENSRDREGLNSEFQSLESVQAQLRNLQEENSKLREQLNNLDAIEELLVYRVAEKSQNKILGLAVAMATVLAVLLGAFSWFRIEELLDSDEIKDKIAEIAANSIIEDPTQIDEIANKVASILAGQQQAKIAGEVEVQLVQAAERVKKENPELAEALQPSISEHVYFVVAGSSTTISTLRDELERVKNRKGNANLFASGGIYARTKICPPKSGNKLNALVIAENKTLREAIEIVERAQKDGFRKDTYQLQRDRAFFNCFS